MWWIQTILPSSEIGQATGLRIGTLIATKQWRAAAEEFANVATERPVLRVGLEACLPLFGVIRKIRLLIAGVSLSHHTIDLWQAFGNWAYSYIRGDQENAACGPGRGVTRQTYPISGVGVKRGPL